MPLEMRSPSKFNILVSGQGFSFTKDQLESEPDNYFANHLLETSSDGSQLEIEKDPAVFKLIQLHLRGYEVFPFPDTIIPPYMTRESFVKNILADARLFKLPKLERKAESFYEHIATTSADQYTLVVGGDRFVLTKDQIQSDPGNHFDTYFFGKAIEVADGMQELRLAKEPAIFKIIQAHLRGYEVFPISDGLVPVYMSEGLFIKNIWIESQYYGLTNLEEKAKKYYEEMRGKLKKKKHKFGTAKLNAELAYKDISEAGFNALLQRVSSSTSHGIIISLLQPTLEGFVLVACWAEYTTKDVCNGRYALFESIDETVDNESEHPD